MPLPSTDAERARRKASPIVSTKVRTENDSTSITYEAHQADGEMGMWKPLDGEPGIAPKTSPVYERIPVGTQHKREAAASAIAQHLGVEDILPATVVHDDGGRPGSLQAWVHNSKKPSKDPDVVPANRYDSERMRVFDFVTGNADRHIGNVLAVRQPGGPDLPTIPILIDNGACFPVGPPELFRRPHSFEDFSSGPLHPDVVTLCERIPMAELAQTLAAHGIEEDAIRHTLLRAQFLKENPRALEVTAAMPTRQPWDIFSSWNDVVMEAHNRVSAGGMDAVTAIMKSITVPR